MNHSAQSEGLRIGLLQGTAFLVNFVLILAAIYHLS